MAIAQIWPNGGCRGQHCSDTPKAMLCVGDAFYYLTDSNWLLIHLALGSMGLYSSVKKDWKMSFFSTPCRRYRDNPAYT